VQAACAVGSSATQPPQPTQDVNAVVQTGVALTQAANAPVVPADTLAPVVILPTMTSGPVLPTNTTAPAVQGTANYSANCRSGPGANFSMLVVISQGSKVDIIGTNKATDGSLWWLVRSTGNPDCWLVDGALSITGDKGSVAVVVSPPTPTPLPIPTWGYTWTYWIGGGFDGAVDDGGTITFTQTGNIITGTYYNWGYQFNVTGTVSADGMTVNGTATRTADSFVWPFVLKRDPSNLNQFRGSWWWTGGGTSWDGSWCGAMNGAAKPSPCKTH